MSYLTERLLNAQYHNHEEDCCCGEECCCHDHEEKEIERQLSEEEIEKIIEEKYSEKDEKTKEFIRKGLRKFGDRFDYSETEYKDRRTKVIIICRKHNTTLEQLAAAHIAKSHENNPCLMCKSERYSLSLQEFIEKARKVHGDKYDYSSVEYKNSGTKVKIFCIKCSKYFYQTPGSHLNGRGCPLCGKEKSSKATRTIFSDFVEKARRVHGDRYDYSKSEQDYKNNKSKITITCRLHGDFIQKVNTHLNGHGCPMCGYDSVSEKLRIDIPEFVRRANEIHGVGKYDYSKITDLKGGTTDRVIIHCNTCGNDFEQVAINHLLGCGCTNCKSSAGERLVLEYLINNGIQPKRYVRLFGVSTVRSYVVPDFLFSIDSNQFWIEYQGEQHYKFIPWIHNNDISEFKTQLTRDFDVREYCKVNNIILIEIPFILNTYSKVAEFLDNVLYNGIDPNIIINYADLYDSNIDILLGNTSVDNIDDNST